MEAKVLRAALSAAIRVTVSTTLVGCGGMTGGEAPGHDEPDPPARQEPQVSASGGTAAVYPPAPEALGQGNNSAGSYPTASAGTTAGGSAPQGEGGAPAAEGGAPAQLPTSLCEVPAMLACEPLLSALAQDPPPWDQPLDPATLGCCQSLVAAVDDLALVESSPACHAELDERLRGVRSSCCPALNFPQGACSPWGPPVPPELELDLEQLLAWGAAA